jgi:hypothetical protein
MTAAGRIARVLGGYAAAAVVACLAVFARSSTIDPAVAQAASGMYAFGDTILFAGVFGVVALVPTAMALVFLRPFRRVWIVLAWVTLVTASTGVLAAVLFAIGRSQTGSVLAAAAQVSVLRLLIAPLLGLAFGVVALFCPTRSTRALLAVGACTECVIAAYAALVWFVPLILAR